MIKDLVASKRSSDLRYWIVDDIIGRLFLNFTAGNDNHNIVIAGRFKILPNPEDRVRNRGTRCWCQQALHEFCLVSLAATHLSRRV